MNQQRKKLICKIKRLACATAAKKVLQEKLSAQVKLVEHDHNYVCTHTTVTDAAEPVCDMTEMMQPNLVTKLYTSHVVVNTDHRVSLEENTRSQSASELWFEARKFRITASIMRGVP